MTKVTVHKDAPSETPSESIIKAANKATVVKDALGRTIGVKKMLLLDRMRMFEVIGPENSVNQAYAGFAALAYSVTSIDGDPVARPSNKIQLESLLQRLGDEGIDAVADHFEKEAKAAKEEADANATIKNGSSTPN
ncbi:hypothetical protein [Limnoglobus roseus]|uniref:Uncharacterized protein n=1 Tax=Limnoglobus roseus TaxID=2598579 RepID=A0A5C1ACM3_9BACT|nr:hypothetical protein [Limnoglobus roseus]QEL14788.1 hypothetical protein PX52LOC_01682 [Limnoglobus roseus]